MNFKKTKCELRVLDPASSIGPVPGQQFEYGFDDIGNRTVAKSGGDASGAASALRSSSYTPNTVNQYTDRSNPPTIDVMGLASPWATVSVNGDSTGIYRHGQYYRKELTVANYSYPGVAVSATAGAMSATAPSGNVFIPPATESYQYYDNGNLKRDGRWDYTWDAEHRLTKMETLSTAPAGSKRRLEFQYDYKGRRIWKRETNLDSSAVVVRKYVYDGWNLLAELDSGNSLIRSYIWGTDLSGSMHGAGGVGGLLGLKGTDGIVHFTAYDGSGNVVGLVNGDTGEISAQYEYGPFGELLRETGVLAKANPFKFSTKFTDRESGMVYYGYRYYNPATGRWLSRDPIGVSDGPNECNFVGNNPVNYADFNGLWKINRNGGPRATVTVDDCSDTVESLAKKVGLDAKEARFWLKPKDGGQLNSEHFYQGEEFTIPNKVLIVVGYSLWRQAKMSTRKVANYGFAKMHSKGFYAIFMDRNLTDFNAASVLAHRDADLWGFAFVGHGEVFGGDQIESGGTFVVKDKEMIAGPSMSTKHHYGLVIAYLCSAMYGGWSDLVSPNGFSYVTQGWMQIGGANTDQTEGAFDSASEK